MKTFTMYLIVIIRIFLNIVSVLVGLNCMQNLKVDVGRNRCQVTLELELEEQSPFLYVMSWMLLLLWKID